MALPNFLIWALIILLPIVIVIGAYYSICSLKRKKHPRWKDDEHVLKSILALSVIPLFVVFFFLLTALPILITISNGNSYSKYRVIGKYEGLSLEAKRTYVVNKSNETCFYLSCFYGKPYKYAPFSKSDKVVQIHPGECVLAEHGVKDVFNLPPRSVVYKSRSRNFPDDHYIGFVLSSSLYQEYLSK